MTLFISSSSSPQTIFQSSSQSDSWQATGEIIIGDQTNFVIQIESVYNPGSAGVVAIDDVEFSIEQCAIGKQNFTSLPKESKSTENASMSG